MNRISIILACVFSFITTGDEIMAQMTTTELATLMQETAQKVRVGGTYVHYRSPDKPYKVLQVALLEENEEPCVVYQALYGDRLIWVRSLSKFLDVVDQDGKKVSRFQQI